jgi:cytochrome c peroxidase
MSKWLPFLLAFCLSCKNDKLIEVDSLALPSDLQPPMSVERNPSSKDGIALGRALFYDPILSKNKNVSCQSCHIQSKAFTDGVDYPSNGSSRKKLNRNSPTLVNLAWSNYFFWDGGATDLESQAYMPLTHKDEMAIDLNELVARLNWDSYYRKSFKLAFSIDSISSPYIVRALAQFQRSIVSFDSKYDRYKRGEVRLNEIELKGLNLFTEKRCASCHTPPLFHDNSFHNTGLDSGYADTMEGIFLGRYRITQLEKDRGKFKTPTLRNIILTGPYMHDGRFASLDDVLEHYSEGLKYSPTLDEKFIDKKGNAQIKISKKEGDAIISFLRCLTDSSLMETRIHSSFF